MRLKFWLNVFVAIMSGLAIVGAIVALVMNHI